MRGVRVLAVILCIVYAVSPKPETKPGKPPVHKVIEGDNFLYVCNATETSQVEIFWTKNDTKHQYRENGTELKFINIDRTFAGDYICYSVNLTVENETEANATLVEGINIDVLYPAKVTRFALGPDVVTENETFTISCTIEGNPDPVWSIMNNRTKQAMVASTMAASASITSWPSRCEDAGFWMCSGYNKLNHNINTTQGRNVTVFCSPKPDLDAEIQYRIMSRPGMHASFVMYNYGNPYPSYTWAHDGKVLPHHLDNNTFSMLNISSVQVKDFGKYTLTMSNSVGRYAAEYQLVPFGGPEAPSSLNFSDVTSNSVTLRWTSGYDMGYQQFFFVFKWDGYQLVRISNTIYDESHNHGVGDIVTYTVRYLTPSTYYKLTVSAENGYGNASYCKEWAEFTTLSEPPTHHKGHQRRAIIIGCSVGGIALIGFAAFLVYMIKYRNYKTSYEVMSGQVKS